MRIRVVVRSRPSAGPPASLFSGTLPARRRAFLPFFCSVAAHVFLLALVFSLSQYGLASPDGALDLSAYHVEFIRLRVPDRIYLPAAPAPGAGKAAGLALPGAGRSALSLRVQLPPLRRTSLRGPAILQPDLAIPPRALRDVLPAMALWTPPTLERPTLRQAAIPPAAAAPPVPPALDAPPVLAIPNRQPLLADLSLSLPPVPAPVLPVPNSSTAPLRLRDSGTAAAAQSDERPGQAANVIVLGAPYLPGDRIVQVPRGLQSAPPSDGGGTPVGPEPGGSPGKPALRGAAARYGENPAGGQVGTPGGGAVATGPSVFGPGLHSAAPPAVIRMAHSPGGNFDVVVVQSVSSDDLPDLGRSLTGNPVYTVYLPVGDAREWLLEYCLPGPVEPLSNPYQITVGDTGVITPPYPLATAIPAGVLQGSRPGYIVLHAALTAAGAFRDVTAVNPGDPLVLRILPLLAEWRFRPAARDGQPVEVEVLLVVPPHA